MAQIVYSDTLYSRQLYPMLILPRQCVLGKRHIAAEHKQVFFAFTQGAHIFKQIMRHFYNSVACQIFGRRDSIRFIPYLS